MKDKNTLYVTDLDGTLVRNDKTLSDFTVRTINSLIEQGMLITYATARSFHSAWEITKEIQFSIPVITRNGTVLANQILKKETEISYFSKQDICQLKKFLVGIIEHIGFVTSYFDGKMMKTFRNERPYSGLQKYIDEHVDDKRMQAISAKEDIFSGNVSYVTLIADRNMLQPIYDKINCISDWECVFSKDTYGDDYWLEVCPKNATKAKAVLKTAQRLGCNRVVVFGDSINDLTMFEIADEACAVKNGLPEVKAAASKIIQSNEEDGVAKYLLKQWL